MDDQWKLKKFNVELKEYGTDAGKYEASVAFRNGKGDAFIFALNAAQTQNILDVVAMRVVNLSEELAEQLASSLGVDRSKPEEDAASFVARFTKK